MISQRINRPLFYSFLLQDLSMMAFAIEYGLQPKLSPSPDSFVFKCWCLNEPVSPMADDFLTVFDGETVKEVMKNVNSALTCSKHFLMYDKQDLIWFQKSLARMKNARGAFKD